MVNGPRNCKRTIENDTIIQLLVELISSTDSIEQGPYIHCQAYATNLAIYAIHTSFVQSKQLSMTPYDLGGPRPPSIFC